MKLIHQLTSGMAGWLTFEQMRQGVDNLSEHALYKPLEDIAKGRRFEVKEQFPIPKTTPGRGARKTIDFVLVDRKSECLLALEVKYKNGANPMAGSLSEDALKLRNFTLDNADEMIRLKKAGAIKTPVTGFTLARALLFVWPSAHGVKHVMQNEQKPLRRQFSRLARPMLAAGVEVNGEAFECAFLGKVALKPVANKYGSLRWGSTITNERFWVACFRECEFWSDLQA